MPRKPDEERGSKREDTPPDRFAADEGAVLRGVLRDRRGGRGRPRGGRRAAGRNREAAEDAAGGDREIT